MNPLLYIRTNIKIILTFLMTQICTLTPFVVFFGIMKMFLLSMIIIIAITVEVIILVTIFGWYEKICCNKQIYQPEIAV